MRLETPRPAVGRARQEPANQHAYHTAPTPSLQRQRRVPASDRISQGAARLRRGQAHSGGSARALPVLTADLTRVSRCGDGVTASPLLTADDICWTPFLEPLAEIEPPAPCRQITSTDAA